MRIAAVALWVGALASTPVAAAAADYVVSYVEGPARTAAALERNVQAYARRTRANPAKPAVEVLSEIGRSNRLVVVERWPGAAPGAADTLAKDLEGQLEGPLDRRVHTVLTPLIDGPAKGPFHMLMHVDVAPPGAEVAAKALAGLREQVLAAPGALQFEAATQADRTNHFTVHEVWTSRAAYEAFAAGPAAQALRQGFVPYRGAPFDDRFYLAAPAGARR